jgi:hypothetical protein
MLRIFEACAQAHYERAEDQHIKRALQHFACRRRFVGHHS